jgi:hypothetical protein
MTISGTLKPDYGKGRLGGKPYSFDLGLDVLHISVLDATAAFSDYISLPDKEPFKDRYLIVDFDSNKRVVGFTIEGLLEDYRETSLTARLKVDLGLIGLQHVSAQVIEKVLEYIRDQIPVLDAHGQLPGYSPA